MKVQSISLFVSCYNEAPSIIKTLKKLILTCNNLNIEAEFLVVDDCSFDDSVSRIRQFISQNQTACITLITNKVNVGPAHSMQKALAIAKSANFRWICGDDPEPLSALKKIFQHIGKYDLILPYHKKVTGKTKTRLFLSKIYTFLVNLASGNNIKYYNGLCIAKKIDFIKYCNPKLGFCCQADFVTQILNKTDNYVEIEIPVVHERKHGASSSLSKKNLLAFFSLIRRLIKRRFKIWLKI